MKEFKFRGRTESGKFVYGDLIHKDEVVLIRTSKSYRYHEVDPESVSLLVGHDCDGAEVYEGDVLEDTLTGDSFIVSVHVFPGGSNCNRSDSLRDFRKSKDAEQFLDGLVRKLNMKQAIS